MAFAKFLTLATVIAFAAAKVKETISGYKFIHSGPSISQTKLEYEMSAARTALSLLKERLGDDGLAKLLEPDIKAADAFWHNIMQKSNPGKWIAAESRAIAFFPDLTFDKFARWSLSPRADQVNNDVNPEHYFKRTVETSPGSGVHTAEILEGLSSQSFPNSLSKLLETKSCATVLMLSSVSVSVILRLLRGGTLSPKLEVAFTNLASLVHIAMRPVPAAEFNEAKDGLEIVASVWYGDACTDDFLEAERQHMVNEIINLTIQAQKDIEDGILSRMSNLICCTKETKRKP